MRHESQQKLFTAVNIAARLARELAVLKDYGSSISAGHLSRLIGPLDELRECIHVVGVLEGADLG